MLKDTLVSTPILKYPDTSKRYTIFTDASKYGWARVLTQEQQKKNKKMFRVGRKRKITDSSQGYEAKKSTLGSYNRLQSKNSS